MALTKIRLGTNEDGSPQWHYISDGPVVLTGPIRGSVTLPDGTVVDVTDEVVEAASDAQAAAIGAAIDERNVAEGVIANG